MTGKEFKKLYGGKYKIVNCPTEELANEFLKEADEHGYKWANRRSYLEENNWETHAEETCYDLFNGCCQNVDFYEKHGCKIIEFKGFEKQSYIQQVAKMLGVEIGEEFEIDKDNKYLFHMYNPYHFDKDGIYDVHNDKRFSVLFRLLEEKVKIIKLPQQWKPQLNEEYWTISFSEEKGVRTVWVNDVIDKSLLKRNMVFKTKEEAEKAYQAVLKTLEQLKETEK